MASNPLTKERLEEMEHDLAVLPDTMGHRLDAAELRALLTAYRTREAAIAECEAWRRKAGKLGEITGTWYTNGSMIRVPVPEADATDAARREEVKGE